jgi:hypothetical protein
LWLENLEEHLITVIAGVLRLRAPSRPLCDSSTRRFAQDDGFVGGLKTFGWRAALIGNAAVPFVMLLFAANTDFQKML